MPIEAYSPADSRSRLADWVEVSALTSAVGTQTREQFLRAATALEEPAFDADDEDLGESPEDESDGTGSRYILDDRQQNLADRVLDELEYRSTTLGENYPFTILAAGTSWKLAYRPATSGSARFANFAYAVCLLVSAIKYKYVLLHHLKAEYRAIADHFQLMAFLVAPEVLGGDAYWMGWPRPDDTTKLGDALRRVTAMMRLGQVRPKPPEWDSAWAKDGTVDLVAWKHFVGRTPGAIILYGQVASGMDWRQKPLRTYFDPYYTGWFEQTPSKRYLHSMFIPYPMYEDCKPTKGESFDKKAYQNGVRDERTFGIIIDRLRLTDLAAKRYERLGKASALEDGLERRLATLYRWRIFAERLGAPV